MLDVRLSFKLVSRVCKYSIIPLLNARSRLTGKAESGKAAGGQSGEHELGEGVLAMFA